MSGHSFPNVSQISNLNKSITATATSRAIFICHTMGSEREDPNPHALQRDLARTHPSSSATIGFSNPLFCIFLKKQGLEEKSDRDIL